MAHSPPKAVSGKDAESDQRNPEANEEMARFEDLAKKLLRVSKEDLKRELEKEKSKKAKKP
jgi:hypothetical protein